jgi:hypothetical protein
MLLLRSWKVDIVVRIPNIWVEAQTLCCSEVLGS